MQPIVIRKSSSSPLSLCLCIFFTFSALAVAAALTANIVVQVQKLKETREKIEALKSLAQLLKGKQGPESSFETCQDDLDKCLQYRAALLTKKEALEKEVVKMQAVLNGLADILKNLESSISECGDLKEECIKNVNYVRNEISVLEKEVNYMNNALDTYKYYSIYQAANYFFQRDLGKKLTTALIFNTSYSGNNKERFYEKVSGISPVIFLSHTQLGSTFGACINVSYPIMTGFKADPDAFTFSMQHAKTCPVKTPQQAIYNSDEVLFGFGCYEIKVERGYGTSTGEAIADQTYQCNAENKNSFYASSEYFTVEFTYIYKVLWEKA